MENILVIGAHPDDIELGCMGTLLKLQDEGKSIIYLVMTNGENWELKTFIERVEEVDNVRGCINIRDIIFGEFTDGHIEHSSKIIDFLTEVIKKYEIDTVFCQYYKDTHQDHVNTCLNALSIKGSVKNLIFYESLTSTEFKPNLFIDITAYESYKKKLLGLFTSQIEKYNIRNQNLISYIDAKDTLNGIQIHSQYAEGFMVNKMII